MKSKFQFLLLSAALLAGTCAAASADIYKSANFTFGVFGGNANQQSPFVGVVAPYPAGGQFTGSLVFDQSLVPGSGTGYQNVFFSSFPDIAQVPNASALSFQLGSLPAFTLGSAATEFGTQEAAIQYNNGNFAGLFFISDFIYAGNPYELQIQGGSLSIVAIVDGNPGFQSLVNGYVNQSLSNIQTYVPPSPNDPGNPGGPTTSVPEPVTLSLVGAGLAGAFAARRRRRKAKTA